MSRTLIVSGTCQQAESLYLDESDAFINALPVIVLLGASVGSQTWNTTIKIIMTKIIMLVRMLMIMMKTIMALILMTTTTTTNTMVMTMLVKIMEMMLEIILIL